MKRILCTITISVIMLVALISSSANADIKDSERENLWEMYFYTTWVNGQEIDFENNKQLDVNGDLGWGLGLGYNLNEHVELGFTFGHNSSSFTAYGYDENDEKISESGTLDKGKIFFNATYNILPKTLTPFITGGFGWTIIDSNIAIGGDPNCWIDPYYGLQCSNATYTDTSFSYNVGLGVRWDVTDTTHPFFLKGSINNYWVNMDNAQGTPSFIVGRFDMGLMF